MTLTAIKIVALGFGCILIFFGSNWSRKTVNTMAQNTEKTSLKLAIKGAALGMTVVSTLIVLALIFAIAG